MAAIKKSRCSAKLQIWALSLIPLAFTMISLGTAALGLPNFAIPFVAVNILWILVGRRGAKLLPHYGKALASFHWLGLVCFCFALVYYAVVPYHPTDLAILWFPLGITKYIVGDAIAQLFSLPFAWGEFFNPIYETGYFGFFLVLTNTLIAMVLFTIGYMTGRKS